MRRVTAGGHRPRAAPGAGRRGAGLYHTKVANADGRNNLGLNGGGGLRFRLMDFDAFVEARYHAALNAIGSGDGERAAQYVPITFGIAF